MGQFSIVGKTIVKVVVINFLITCTLILFVLLTPYLLVQFYGLTCGACTKFRVADKKEKLIYNNNLQNIWSKRPELIGPLSEDRDIKNLYQDYVIWSNPVHAGKDINILKNSIRSSTGAWDFHEKANLYVFLGGSTMFGYGVSDSNTIPSKFNELTGKSVVNMGVSGYLARQSLIKLSELLGTNLMKEVNATIISYDGANDVSHRCRVEITGLETGYQKLIRDSINSSVNIDDKFTLSYLIKPWQELISRYSMQTRDEVDPQQYNCSTNTEKANMIASTLISNWRQMHILAKAHGLNFIAILQPIALYGKPLLVIKKSETEKVIEEQITAVYPLILEKVKKENFQFYDLTNELNGKAGESYFDYAHLDSTGNGIIAKKLSYLVDKKEIRNKSDSNDPL